MMSLTSLGVSMGFLEAADDVEGIIKGIHRNSEYLSIVCLFGHDTPVES